MNGCIRTGSDCSTMSPMGPCRAVMDMISLSMQQVTSQPRKYQEPLYWIGHVASSYRGDLGCSGPLLPIFTRLLYNCHAADKIVQQFRATICRSSLRDLSDSQWSARLTTYWQRYLLAQHLCMHCQLKIAQSLETALKIHLQCWTLSNG